MRHIVAHILGLDKELIEERIHNNELDAKVLRLKSENKQLQEELNDMRRRYIAENSVVQYLNKVERTLQDELDAKNKKILSLSGRIGALNKKIKQWEKVFAERG